MTTFSPVSLTRLIGANTLIDIEGEFLVIYVDEKKANGTGIADCSSTTCSNHKDFRNKHIFIQNYHYTFFLYRATDLDDKLQEWELSFAK